MFEDREENLWLDSLLNGLSRFRRRVVTTISTRNGLPADNIYSLVQSRTRDVWVGTWGSGICRIVAGRVDPASIKLAGQYISSLAEDHAGQLWVGTSGAGLVRIDGDRITPLELPHVFVF